MRSLRGFGRASRGAMAIEFAAIMPLLIGLILAIAQIGVSFYFSSLVQASVFALAREINSSPTPPGTLEEAAAIVKSAPGMGGMIPIVSVRNLHSGISPQDVPTSNVFETPTPGQFCVVTVAAPRPMFMPVGPLAKIFPMLFSDTIAYTIIAVP